MRAWWLVLLIACGAERGPVELSTARATLIERCVEDVDRLQDPLREEVCRCTWAAMAADRDLPVAADRWMRGTWFPDTAPGGEWTEALKGCADRSGAWVDYGGEVSVMRARHELPAGHRIEAGDVEVALVERQYLATTVVSPPAVAVGRVTRSRVLAGEFVRTERLTPPGTPPGPEALALDGLALVWMTQPAGLVDGLRTGNAGDVVRLGEAPCLVAGPARLTAPDERGGPIGVLVPEAAREELEGASATSHAVWIRGYWDRAPADLPNCGEDA